MTESNVSEQDTPRGWTTFGNQSRKFHYLPADSDRALCGKWGLSPFVPNARATLAAHGGLEVGHDDHPANCAACKRKKAKLDA